VVRNSKTEPLKISAIAADKGLIGMTFCPGKIGPSTYGAPWNRDLAADIEVIPKWHPAAVVTLMEPHEFELLGTLQLGQAIESAGMEWYHFADRDVDEPDEIFRLRWVY
jgi:ADP-ribosyl-[dinitrogen reductase] hydrolase